jgi:hypothetical protein
MEAAMETRYLPLLCRLDGPAVVPQQLLRTAKTYRQAVRLCKIVSPRRHIALRQLAEEAGLTYQHVSDYFNPDDKPTRRSLPGEHVAAVERVLGNTAITQWHAAQAQLTIVEQLMAERNAA